MIRGNWTNEPCFYCSCIDAGKTALVLGPFRTEEACRKYAYRSVEDGGDIGKNHALREIADKVDPKSCFYSWGMVKMATGHRDGVLNQQVIGDQPREFYGEVVK